MKKLYLIFILSIFFSSCYVRPVRFYEVVKDSTGTVILYTQPTPVYYYNYERYDDHYLNYYMYHPNYVFPYHKKWYHFQKKKYNNDNYKYNRYKEEKYKREKYFKH